MAKFCKHEKHGGICVLTDTPCNPPHIAPCPVAEMTELAPVAHGHWSYIDVSPVYEHKNGERVVADSMVEEECSLCKVRMYRYESEGKWNYCPNCGANMRGEQDG